jgi:2-oxoisovalerate dehydrogenase E1 component beta subunit
MTSPTPDVTYLEAIRRALADAMRADERVFLIGEDIGVYGGAFRATAGLLESFGPGRVIDTPIAEAGIIGAAIGAALMGRRPVAEMQFIDFVANGFQLLTNFAARFHYRLGQPVPMVVRGPCGGGVGAGPFHSQNVEAYFLHTPGLKIVAPATAADAYSLLRAAIADPNPVLVLEHKLLYRRERGPLPAPESEAEVQAPPEPLGAARVVRAGRDLTIVTFGAMVGRALEAAVELEAEGVEAEVIDLRTLAPWDRETVLASVRRTGRALVVHEAARTGGVGAEYAATIAESCFDWLDAPVERLGALDVPVPYAAELERAVLPGATGIARQALRLARR